ncbi:hypothetical protein QWY75_10430 [Pontixanthobacter aestiaquae]|uniref:Uncharacterized protein n=1 Tax=Pontixanthobacter aestiaquae TaxID=1509367 RepID=A0A844Z100_9SPHN|nr:hypothetical protein [Pontixanthobacter aestiaquae]MDN3646614.1 hypothetical protein [Pontixanthobacter aestiaquae]MXO82401.1 hypothetical protein [Pontixanthobacter aestiaquae]
MMIRIVLRGLLVLAPLCALPAPALADGWDCVHNIKENGINSHSTISYHDAGPDPQQIIGPYHQVGWKGFYTGWPNVYETLDSQFVQPRTIGFSVYPGVPIKQGIALFKRAGSKPVRLRVSSAYFSRAEKPPRVHFSVKSETQIAALLAHKDWTVEFRTRRGRLIDTVPHRFAVDLAGMRDLYNRHIVGLRAMKTDIRGLCRENRDEEVIL